MCGIVGYLGNASGVDVRDGEFFTGVTSGAMPVLFDLLKKLEYRGYDSAGIAILNGENDEIRTFKTEGSVDDLISITPDLGGHIGIGHTRWATHGKPSTMNAHPHSDGTGRIALVHNGIIENYTEIKDKLIDSGHEFRSETDTEVLPHLIEEYYDGDLESAVRNALSMVRGSYALAAISVDDPGKIVVARKDSVIGRDCNLGAGTKIANLQYDGRNIHAVVKGESVDAGRRKLGVVMGDGVHTGINTSINVGVMMAAGMSTRPGEVLMR
jgi:glucosamine--fructose-6-phosphate aminotransferase (isomerizing)